MMRIHECSLAVAILCVLATPALGQPAAVTLIAPSTDVPNGTIAFSWHSTTGATWYQLWLGTLSGSLVTEQWYTAEHAGCASGATCNIVVTPPTASGAFVWYIRGWGPSGYGPWSAPHLFTIKDPPLTWAHKLPASRRFTLVFNGEGVLDHETGLVWQRFVSTITETFSGAANRCAMTSVDGRWGWRPPTVAELTSLFEPGLNPTLPAGHPFSLSSARVFWSQTMVPLSTTHAFGANFEFATPAQIPVQSSFPVWCVRGGSAAGH
jgi:hypothetical protein